MARGTGTTGEEEKTQQPNYEKDLAINKHRLDEEFERHPIIQMRYAKVAAQADAAAKRAAEKVKTIRSEIAIVAKREGIPGIPKPTKDDIEAYYRTNIEHQKAKEEMIAAEEVAALLNGAVSAMRARRSSLENLAQLHLSGYFSSPRNPEGADFGSDESLKERAGETAKRKAAQRRK